MMAVVGEAEILLQAQRNRDREEVRSTLTCQGKPGGHAISNWIGSSAAAGQLQAVILLRFCHQHACWSQPQPLAAAGQLQLVALRRSQQHSWRLQVDAADYRVAHLRRYEALRSDERIETLRYAQNSAQISLAAQKDHELEILQETRIREVEAAKKSVQKEMETAQFQIAKYSKHANYWENELQTARSWMVMMRPRSLKALERLGTWRSKAFLGRIFGCWRQLPHIGKVEAGNNQVAQLEMDLIHGKHMHEAEIDTLKQSQDRWNGALKALWRARNMAQLASIADIMFHVWRKRATRKGYRCAAPSVWEERKNTSSVEWRVNSGRRLIE
ncbi:hypothetical protein CYMTET_34495, partial [Cymbomonas tetramitiformis]